MSDRPGLSLASSMRLFQKRALELSGRQIYPQSRQLSQRDCFGRAKTRSYRVTRSQVVSPARPFAEEQVNGVGLRSRQGNSSQESKQFRCSTSQTRLPSSNSAVPHPKPISTAFSLQPQTTCDLSLTTDMKRRLLQTRFRPIHPLLQTRFIHFKSLSLFEQFPMACGAVEMRGNERQKGKSSGKNLRGKLKSLLSSPRTGLRSKAEVRLEMTVCGSPVKLTNARPAEL